MKGHPYKRCILCGGHLRLHEVIWCAAAGRRGGWVCLSPSICRWRRKRQLERRQLCFEGPAWL